MTRRLVAGYLVITLVVLAVLEIPLGVVFASRERDRLEASIERDTRVVAAEIDDRFEVPPAAVDLVAVARDFRRQTGGRLVIVDATGNSLVDSSDLSGAPRSFADRTEVRAALGGSMASGRRYSSSLDTDLLYVAVPIAHEGVVAGAVRVTYPSSTVDSRVRELWWRLGGLAVVVLVSVGFVGWLVARSLSEPIRTLRDASHDLGVGDLSTRVDVDRGPPEVRDLAATFNQMAQRLEHLVATQRAFLADASHQLRTPLTALRLRLESLADDEDDPDVDAARAEVDRLSRLVDGLLTVARLDAVGDAVVAVDTDAVTADRVAMWGDLFEEQSVALRVTGAGGRALAPEEGLEQVLDNLLSNALEVAPAGSEVVVSLGGEGPAGRGDHGGRRGVVVISVRDEGPGMNPSELGRAFDRFWRSPSAPPGGTGLGLAVVRQLAEAAGGSAVAEAAPGGGLVVTVRLPRA